MRCVVAALLVMGLAGGSPRAQDNVLEKFVGRWDMRVKTLQPQKPDLTTWDARNRTMEWKSPPLLDVSYQARCTFTDDNNQRCTLVLKNWLGKVLLEQDSTAIRRND
jgi:hypothetical protein